MQRCDFINIIREYPKYAESFNNSDEFVNFPSSFGIYKTRNNKWRFYEIDERGKIVQSQLFSKEFLAYDFVLQHYDIITTKKCIDIRTIEKIVKKMSDQVDLYHNALYKRSTMLTANYCKTGIKFTRRKKKGILKLQK